MISKPGDWTCHGCGGLVFASKQTCKCGASKSTAASVGKPGDWICQGCQGLVFSFRSQCNKCGASKPGASSQPAAGTPSGAQTGDWTCPNCGDYVFARNSSCRKCGTSRPAAASGTHVASSGAKATWDAPSGDWTCPKCADHVFASRNACRKCGTSRPAAVSTYPVHSAASDPKKNQSTSDWTCPKCSDHVFARNCACRKCGTARPAPAAPVPEGDWNCPSCGDLQFASRQTCRMCHTPRPGTQSDAPRVDGATLRAGDWRCPGCSDVQFAKNETCRRCGTQRPEWLGARMGLAPPSYWTNDSHGQSKFSIVPASQAEMEALSFGVHAGGSLGGRDQRTKLDYKNLRLACAWRIQHPGLWGKYAMERENIRTLEVKSLQDDDICLPDVHIRSEFVNMMRALPAELDSNINEVLLSHGSKPESVLAILSSGLNERFSGGLFGNGTYLAEDFAKNDQYCTYDAVHGAHPDLHKLLFDETGLTHPGDILYVFICRVVLGCRVRTKDGATDMDHPTGRSIWSSKSRELVVIEGSNPPVIHHSLLVELGGRVARFREFVLFHGDRIYPEYLVAYKRS